MKKLSLSVMLAILAAVLFTGVSAANCCKDKKEMSSKSDMLKMDMRMLWEDHINYTHMYIVAAVAGSDDAGKLAERLLKNQQDIGDAIKPYYGDEAGNKLTALLKDHILIAAELVGAAKAGDSAKAAEAEKKWYANADDIAAFLSGANKNWTKESLVEMMKTHLSLTKTIAVARLNKDVDAEIKAADSNHEHILMMADALSSGIVKQFPKKFEGKSCS